MASPNSKFSAEDSSLISDLTKLSKKSPKLVKSTEHAAPVDKNIKIRSWKMNEFKYYDIPSPFPTLARGLFTVELPKETEDEDEDRRYRIVVRGYDKFFNIGEVPWTHWSSLEARTTAPYTLTLKSNGCIIFIAALTPTQLIVTSKHSIGAGVDPEKSHAVVGERWLERHLKGVGKTKEGLAKTLWDDNLTAIAELCDDTFEEHVLAYPPSKTGLHLHGLNLSTKAFTTLPPTSIDAFASTWGFIPTPSIILHSISEVKAFTEEVGGSGMWNGEAIEGFVVRTHLKEYPFGGESEKGRDATPYGPGSTLFFKVKFDEPYMMYRDWRELTKKLLSATSSSSSSIPIDHISLPKNKLKRPETQLYVRWAKAEIKRDRKQFDGYLENRGIVRTRERFLEWVGSEEGKRGVEAVNVDEGEKGGEKVFGKTVIVPVAIPGCGKTSVAIAIKHLFGFGHTQSDDVKTKKPAPQFIKNVKDLLKKHDVVIADKNNHLRQHRDQLREIARQSYPPIRLLAWYWSTTDDQPPAMIHRIMGDRILARGDNHQALHGDASGSHEDVLWMFLNQAEDLEEGEVDEIVEMGVGDSLEVLVGKAVEGCVRVLGVERPSQERVEEALEVVKKYKVKTHMKQSKKKKEDKPPRYYGFLPEVDLKALLDPVFSARSPEQGKTFWEDLLSTNSVTGRPHVTITHRNSLPAEQDVWDRCTTVTQSTEPPSFTFKLGHVVWNERVMALTVEDVQLESAAGVGQEGAEFVSKLPHEIRERLHVTVGTKEGVSGFEGMALVKAWKKDKNAAGVSSVKLEGAFGNGRIKGLFG